MQGCIISIANALEILQSYTKPSKYLITEMGETHRGPATHVVPWILVNSSPGYGLSPNRTKP